MWGKVILQGYSHSHHGYVHHLGYPYLVVERLQLVADVVLLELPQPRAHGREGELGAGGAQLGAHRQLGAVHGVTFGLKLSR